MDKINLDQLQKIDIEGETIGVEEALQVLGNFANTASLEIGKINTEIEGMETDVSEKVSSDRLDEFNPDDSAADGLIERWAGGVNWQMDYLEGQVGAIASDATDLWREFREQESRLDNFTPSSSAAAGSIEKWASTVSGGGLPTVTSADAGDYFKVDDNGNIIKYEPSTSIGDGDFSDGHLDSFVTGSAIVELVQQYYDFITGGDDVTRGCLGVKVQEIKERLEDFMEYDIIMGDPIHFTSDPDNHNLIYGTYTITGVNKVDVIRLKENYTGAFNDLIGITFLNLDDYSS